MLKLEEVRVRALAPKVQVEAAAPVKLRAEAEVIARLPAAVDQVVAAAEVKVRPPAEVLQVEAAPAVKVKAAPDLKDEAPALVPPMVIRSAPVVPILMASAEVAVVPAMLIV